MSEEFEKSGDPVSALAEEWKELMTLNVSGEFPSEADFKRDADRIHNRIYDLINDPKTRRAAEDLLGKIHGDVGKDFFDEDSEE